MQTWTSDQLRIAQQFASSLLLRKPYLHVLKPEHKDEYSPLSIELENRFKLAEERGALMLPNLSAFGNETVAIFSDYSGEGSGDYNTYSFLVCSWNSTFAFAQHTQSLRNRPKGLGSKEIAFKDFGMGVLRNTLPEYLHLLENFVPGILFTLAIEKKLDSLFGPAETSTKQFVAETLAQLGFGERIANDAEKLIIPVAV